MKNSSSRHIFFTVCLAMLLNSRAQAGTYNFYFNNAEQGDNSTATPTVTVNDDKGETKKESTPPVDEVDNLPAPAASTQPQAQGEWTPMQVKKSPRFRLIGSLAYQDYYWKTPVGFFEADMESSIPFWEQEDVHTGARLVPQLTASYFFNRHMAASFLLGGMTGLELEASPMSVDSDNLRLAFLVGYGNPVYSVRLWSGSLTLGGRLEIPISKTIALNFAARTSLTSPYGASEEDSFTQAELGLSFYF